MTFLINCDNPAFLQTYLPNPASITMEGILIFNKYLFFLLCIIVLFVAWLLVYIIFYCVGHTNKFNSNFVGSKPLKMTCLSVQTVILLLISVFPSKNFLLVGAANVVVTLYHLTRIKSIVSRTWGSEVRKKLRNRQLTSART